MYLHNVLSAYFSLALNAVSMTLEKFKNIFQNIASLLGRNSLFHVW